MGNTGSQPKNKTGKRVVAQKLSTAQKTNVLSLTEHGLEEIPAQVYTLLSLRTLDVSKNKLKNLGKISLLKELKSINCDENALATSSLSPISNLLKLQTLSLGKNRLDNNSTKSGFPSLPPKLKILRVNGNSFSSIPRQICDPKLPLEKLDLSCNNLAAIPAEICNLAATLTELILDKNAIVSLPIEVGQLQKLKVLSLKNNYISCKNTKWSDSNPQPIPAALFTETPLIDLNLHGNTGLISTQLNEHDGFGVFLERRKKVKTKGLDGGALVDMSLCGLK